LGGSIFKIAFRKKMMLYLLRQLGVFLFAMSDDSASDAGRLMTLVALNLLPELLVDSFCLWTETIGGLGPCTCTTGARCRRSRSSSKLAHTTARRRLCWPRACRCDRRAPALELAEYTP
jgi:hypothetical protein